MNTSITLTPADRNALLHHYRRSPDPRLRTRAHILLLLADGHPWVVIAALLYTSSSTIDRWQRRFRQGGLAAVLGTAPRAPGRAARWAALIVGWVLSRAPADFGFARSRWSCEAVALVLTEDYGEPVGRETVRRWLRGAGLVWRRPRPVLRPKDPRRAAKLRALRAMLRGLAEDETAVFMDEVEVHTNPKVGCMWMRRGEQAEVETPGTDERRVLAGSLHWRTGRALLTEGLPGEGRTAALFCRHLDDLRRRLRRYRVIHVVCDSARTHKPEGSRLVKKYLEQWGGRVVIHYLPLYAPECNPVERVWWRLHEAVTRNHRCPSMEELLALTFDWLEERRYFRVRSTIYEGKAHKRTSLPQVRGAI
ncbi:MAG: IS630 family transposase [Actinobacteria bacterium]|nr:IS630 family transposase [Actinomycetota bacterium]